MKVALVLCGYMRNWKDNFPKVKKEILDIYNPDVYITSYTYSIWNWNSKAEKINTQEVLDFYNPKNYIFRKEETCPKIKFLNNNSESLGRDYSIRQLYGWYTNKLALSLFNFEDYDVIIKHRTDVGTSGFKIDFTKSLVIPQWKYHPGPCDPEDAYVDYIAYGSPSFMRSYFSLYDKIEEMHHNKIDISLGETLLKNYLDKYVTKEIYLDESFDWVLRDEMWASEKAKFFPIVPTIEMDE
jgi:hypothetical protein